MFGAFFASFFNRFYPKNLVGFWGITITGCVNPEIWLDLPKMSNMSELRPKAGTSLKTTEHMVK